MRRLEDLRYLIVNDFHTMGRIIQGLLKELGVIHIDQAESGEDALQSLKAGSFDVVICKHNLYDMHSIELVKAVKADPANARTQFLITVYQANKNEILLAAVVGASGYILMPFSATTLKIKLVRILSRMSLERELTKKQAP